MNLYNTPEYTGENTSHKRRAANTVSVKCANDMKLFGLPYQFIESVDPRIPTVSDRVGVNYIENIMTTAPTCYFIPGKAVFLPGKDSSEKQTIGRTFLELANGDGNLRNLLDQADKDAGNKLRYYDFEESYAEYMKYVNVMCRTAAQFLELEDTFVVGDKTVSLQQYDWKNYRWNKDFYSSQVGSEVRYLINTGIDNIRGFWSSVINGMTGRGDKNVKLNTDEDGTPGWTSNNYLQFYVDPSSGSSESIGNNAGPSQIKSMLDSVTQQVKEFKFVADSAGVSMGELGNMAGDAVDMLGDALNISSSTGMGNVLNQLFSTGRNVIAGENIILPDVYQNSDYGIDYTIDIHLKTPYGNKYSIYVDVIVPFLHLLGLVLPRQGTTNTYSSPFLVKCYFPGVFNCNLGLVERLAVTRPVDSDCFSVDGLPTEIDVQLSIKDLYSDLSMSPSNEPYLFRNNTSMIDYLATITGMSLIEPKADTKFDMFISTYTSAIRDIGGNVKSVITDGIERSFSGFLSL